MNYKITVELLEKFTEYLRVLGYQDVFVEQLYQLRELTSDQRPRAQATKILDGMETNQRCLLNYLNAFLVLHDRYEDTIKEHRSRLEEIYPPDAYKPDPTVLDSLFE
jgi:hypothetical protein